MSTSDSAAAGTPARQTKCDCGRALSTMCSGCIIEDYEATTGRVVSAVSGEGTGTLNTADYRIAPSGDGPQAAEWQNKPHRLVYDLCAEIERLTGKVWDANRGVVEPVTGTGTLMRYWLVCLWCGGDGGNAGGACCEWCGAKNGCKLPVYLAADVDATLAAKEAVIAQQELELGATKHDLHQQLDVHRPRLERELQAKDAQLAELQEKIAGELQTTEVERNELCDALDVCARERDTATLALADLRRQGESIERVRIVGFGEMVYAEALDHLLRPLPDPPAQS